MSTRVDAEEIEITRGEKLLAVVLAVFVFVGAIWGYARLDVQPDDMFRDPVALLAPAERAALEAERDARRAARRADARAERRREELVEAREEYRTALDAGREASDLEAAYRRAQARARAAEALAGRRDEQLAAARAAASPVEMELRRRERAEARRAEDARDRAALVTAVLRLVLVVALLAAALWTMSALRRRRSRFLVAGYAGVAAATALGFVMGVDYVTDYLDPLDLGPIVLSLVGSALTVLALVALQRQVARRLPGFRVRRGECPYCGFPTGRGDHCEGCGREVVGRCGACSAPRRVGTPHCATCGAA